MDSLLQLATILSRPRAWYLPLSFAITVATHFVPLKYPNLRFAISGSILAALLALQLSYRDPSYDGRIDADPRGPLSVYCFFATLDHAYLSYLEGSPPRWIGEGRGNGKATSAGVGEDDDMTFWQRLQWALNLHLFNPRGIGWNWQVKGTPAHSDGSLPRWQFVGKQILGFIFIYVRVEACMAIIGFCEYLRQNPGSLPSLPPQILTIVMSWAIASMLWNGLKIAQTVGAISTVALGLYEPWQWPPMMDSLSKAWSVRQMWGTVYHQLIRRFFQTPAQRIARLLGLKQGTWGSKYFQLYTTFFFSGLFHEFLAVLAIGKSTGDTKFFLLQPVAICVEDFVIWCYEQSVGAEKAKKPSRLLRYLGYVWVFAWFSWSLSTYAPDWFESRFTTSETQNNQSITRGYNWAQQMLA